MAKGFLSGVLWGSVVSVVGLGVVSLQIAPVQPSWVEAEQPTSPDAENAPMDDVSSDAPEAENTPTDDVSNDAPDEANAPTDDVSSDAPDEENTPTDEVSGDAPEASEAPPDAISAPDTPSDAPDVDVAPDTSVAMTEAPDAPSDAITPDEPTGVETNAPAVSAQEPATVPADETDPPVEQAGADAQTDVPQSIPNLANTPQIKSEPVAPINNQVDGVTTNRLPTIDSAPTEEVDEAEQDGAPTDTLSLALERNATEFTNPEGRPLMSIMLVDQGPSRQALGDLNNLPFPVSVVIRADAADAEQAISFYREAGAEVVIEPTLPPNATPTDAEVNFQVQAPLLEQSVAVYMDEASGFQGDSKLAAQISEILAASGHGLVSDPHGLNTGHKTALKTGVAAGVVFRELDGAAQDSKVMQRFLDNAAFKAGQENGVIMLGKARAETLQALIEWSLGNRVNSVAMAPISALLLGG